MSKPKRKPAKRAAAAPIDLDLVSETIFTMARETASVHGLDVIVIVVSPTAGWRAKWAMSVERAAFHVFLLLSALQRMLP